MKVVKKAVHNQTDIMTVPKDWDIKPIGKLLKIHHGKSQKEIKVSMGKGKYPILATSGKIGSTNICLHSKPSVLIGRKGTIDKPQYIETPFWTIDTLFWCELFGTNSAKFMYYMFCLINWKKYNEASGVPSLNAKTIEQIQITVPKPEEQEAIAVALSDVDGLIKSLEKLITKKRDMKIAAMQQLLNATIRLPGFVGEWDVQPVSALCDIISGGTPSTTNPAYWLRGDIPWCTPSDITVTTGKYLHKTERHINSLGLAKSSANLLPEGSLLLCSRATIGEVKISKTKITTNQGFKSLICHSVNNEFMYYKVLTLKDRFLQMSIGSTFLEFSKKDISQLLIEFPKPKEQEAIAQVLSDMDIEIDALEQRLSKTRSLKIGMMQQLLTGRIRLNRTKKSRSQHEKRTHNNTYE